MATPCSCHVIDTALVQAFLRQHGPVFTEKRAKAVRALLHKQRRDERLNEGLADKKLCGICADNVLALILAESRRMYPDKHAHHDAGLAGHPENRAEAA